TGESFGTVVGDRYVNDSGVLDIAQRHVLRRLPDGAHVFASSGTHYVWRNTHGNVFLSDVGSGRDQPVDVPAGQDKGAPGALSPDGSRLVGLSHGELVAGTVSSGLRPFSDLEIANFDLDMTWEPGGRWLFIT